MAFNEALQSRVAFGIAIDSVRRLQRPENGGAVNMLIGGLR